MTGKQENRSISAHANHAPHARHTDSGKFKNPATPASAVLT